MRIDKKGEKSQKLCLTDYNSLTTWNIFIKLQITCTEKEFEKILKKIIQVNVMIFMFKAIHYCQVMYLRNFEICKLGPARTFTVPELP